MSYQVNTMYRFLMGILLLLFLFVSGVPHIASIPLIIVGSAKKKKPLLTTGIIIWAVTLLEIVASLLIFISEIIKGV